MLKDLCGLAGNFHGVQQNTAELKERLSGAKVLLVLDDIWSSDQLRALLVKLGSQSKVLITSRNSDLLRRFLPALSSTTPKCVEIELLSGQHSQQMLCLHAFGQPQAPSALQGLAEEAADTCSGLPLTLSVVGRHLVPYRDVQAWQGVLALLRRAEELDGCASGSIFARLRISYDHLNKRMQDMLVEIACMLLGRTPSIATLAWDVGLLLLENLKNLCLVTVQNGMLGMHDQMRDMLLSIAAEGRHAGWYVRDAQAADPRDTTMLQVCCCSPSDASPDGMAV